MAIELKVPQVGESITEVEIADWLRGVGQAVRKDEPIVTLDSEKATVELPAPESGTLTKQLKRKGEVAKVGEVIGLIEPGADAAPPAKAKEPSKPAPDAAPQPPAKAPAEAPRVMPAAARAMAELGLKPEQVEATGPGGRMLKEDVLRAASQSGSQSSPPAPSAESLADRDQRKAPAGAGSASSDDVGDLPFPEQAGSEPGREEETVPMSRLRRTVAERLVHAQQNAALLTTFNEADMSAIQALRRECGEAFLQKHQVKLGFMSFFVKGCVDALKQFPALNAEVRGASILFRNYFDIGVAVGGGKGLVVPVLRNAEHMSFAEVEKRIADLAGRARQNQLKVEELQGGTFTISNGGVYGSLLSTPIVNPPQSGVLGMHAIQERPVARDGAVVIRPMMYLALTYDHRIVDGREAVSFLKRLKDVLENPARMLIES